MLSRLRDVKGLNIPRPGMLRAERNQACVHFGRDVKGLNIPQHRDVKLNELPKQIFMLLPLLLHWLYFSILGGMPPRIEKIRRADRPLAFLGRLKPSSLASHWPFGPLSFSSYGAKRTSISVSGWKGST